MMPVGVGGVLVAATLLVLGSLMILFSRRRGGYVPRCRRCGYNVTGHLRAEGAARRCPECGASLTAEDAIVSGRGRWQWWLLVPGLVLVWMAIAIGVLFFQSGTINWYGFVPAGIVRQTVREGAQPAAERAFYELERRTTAGSYAIGDLVDAALDFCARGRSDAAWPTDWQAVLSGALKRDAVSVPQQERLLQLVVPASELAVRPVVQRGLEIPFEVRLPNKRWEGTPWLQTEVLVTEIDGQPCPRYPALRPTPYWFRTPPVGWERLPILLLNRHPVGAHVLRFEVRTTLDPGDSGVARATISESFVREVTLLERDQIQPAQNNLSIEALLVREDRGRAELELQAGTGDGAFCIWIDTGGGFASTGSGLVVEAGLARSEAFDLPGSEQQDRMQILLVPAPRYARETVRLRSICLTALLFRDVPVTRKLLSPDPPPIRPEHLELKEAARLLNSPEIETVFESE